MSEGLNQNHREQHPGRIEAEAMNFENPIESDSLNSKSTHEHAENIENIRQNIELHSVESKITSEQRKRVSHENQTASHHYITKKIKSEHYKETMRNVQNNLPKRQQTFSKIIHQPVVEQMSEIGSKTVARPSGIIGGALLALCGSIIIMTIAKHIGFELPNSIFAILFMIGFVVGLVIELLIRALRMVMSNNS